MGAALKDMGMIDAFDPARADFSGIDDPTSSDPKILPTGWNVQHQRSYVVSEPVGASTWYPVNDEPTDKATYRIEVVDGDGLLVAWFQALAHRTSRWHLGEERWPDEWRTSH